MAVFANTPERMPDAPASPCINFCQLDPSSQICQGCWRTLNEIVAWPRLSAQQQHTVVAACQTRAVERANGT
ncbi:DUF1289 domain-containing protein [Lignipirellula cremea]|uniref:DUF1289 domain-containing protein n=1 Tax=Lignipirellula cremea TaxID=2528010 RepID=UPI0018D251A8|nr:DUF1289 domain-containing protein [Lignipirellula cremea]